MNALFLTLLALSVLSTVYGMIRILYLARQYNYRRSLFEQRVSGRRAERRNEDRRSKQLMRQGCPSL